MIREYSSITLVFCGTWRQPKNEAAVGRETKDIIPKLIGCAIEAKDKAATIRLCFTEFAGYGIIISI
jgi:hypothetical protein